ncbi:hypothetical protein ACQ4PT_014543 [Festuca glaucescens]
MAQDDDINNHNAPPATSSDSMNPCKDSNGGEDSSSSRLVVVGAIDKGKGVAKTEGEDQAGRSDGKISPPHVAAATRDGRLGGRHGERELHITTERERRKRMSEMFTKLCGLLPTLPDKVDKSSIVMETIHYIKSLEGTLMELEKRKQEMQLARGKTWSGQNVVLSLSGNDAWINVCVARRPGVLTMVMAVLKKHNINVVTSGISSDNAWTMFTIHARINGATNQLGDNVRSEEIYKLAVSEMLVWLPE